MKGQQKFKILHLIDSSRHGGAEEVFGSLVSGLGIDRYEHYIVLPDSGWLFRQMSKIEGVSVSVLDGKGRFNFHFLVSLIRIIRANNIDLVQTHLFGTSLYGALSGFLCRVPVVCTFHGFIDLPQGARLSKFKFALIGLFANRIVAVSNSLKATMERQFHWGKNKIHTIYNGIDLTQKSTLSRVEARKKIGVTEETLLIGAIGNIKQAKSYKVLIRTAESYAGYEVKSKFMVAGRTDSEAFGPLVALRKELGLESKVLFIGYQENIRDFLKALDVLLLTSESEGFSLVIIEAMNASIPVVATRCGGPEEIITHNIDGVLVEVGDVEGLAAGLQAIQADLVFRERLVQNAQKTVRKQFSFELMVNEYENVYKGVFNKNLRGEEYEQVW